MAHGLDRVFVRVYPGGWSFLIGVILRCCFGRWRTGFFVERCSWVGSLCHQSLKLSLQFVSISIFFMIC